LSSLYLNTFIYSGVSKYYYICCLHLFIGGPVNFKGYALSFFVIILLSELCCDVVADDQAGSISVEVRRIDESTSYYLIIFLICAFLLVALALSIFFLFSRIKMKQGQSAKESPKIAVKYGSSDVAFKGDDYYGTVFASPLKCIADEKARPVDCFINAYDSESAGTVDAGRYLKEDERIILNVLKMKNGSCSQSTLRVATDFSKARLSRLLSELEERGVIYKEPQGKKNIITLKT